MFILWILCIIATCIIADYKKLSVVSYFFLSLITGPLGLIIVLLVSSGKPGEVIQPVEDIGQQLRDLKGALFALQQKVNSHEALIRKLTGEAPAPEKSEAVVPAKKEPVVPQKAEVLKVDISDGQLIKDEFRKLRGQAPEAVQPSTPYVSKQTIDAVKNAPASATKSDMEIDFGRNWLNKIGIVVFTLGMGFLISYTFRYFGPFFKIAFGYLVSAVLFFIGFKLETKEKFANFGRALLGGGWALIYFTTYAMHHFEASRLIESELVGSCLLALVALGMIIYVLRYKSEGIMSLALFVAYVTGTLGQITNFTVISSLFLAVVVLSLVYKFQWIKTFILGIGMTYGIHYFWVMPNLAASAPNAAVLGVNTSEYHLMMNFVFLSAYWLVFFAGTHIVKTVKEPRLVNILAATNFANIALYSALSYPLILKLFYAQRFAIVLGMGILYLVMALVSKAAGRRELYLSDVIAAVFVITFSLTLKFLPVTTMLLWLIEVPFLLFIGFNFKERIYRYLSYGLAVLVGFDFILSGGISIEFLGMLFSWHEFIAFWATISMSLCFYLSRRSLKESKELDCFDQVFRPIFAVAAGLYGTFLVSSFLNDPWDSLGLGAEVVFLLWLGFRFKEEVFRYFSYLLSVFIVFRLILASSGATLEFFGLRWSWQEFWCLWSGIAMAGCFCLTQLAKKRKDLNSIDEIFDQVFPAASCLYLTTLVYSFIKQPWITFALSVEGIILLSIALLMSSVRFRVYAYLVFMGMAGIFITENIEASSVLVKWFLITMDLLIIFAVYFVMKYLVKTKQVEVIFDKEEAAPFWAGIALLIFAIFVYIPSSWITLGLGTAGMVWVLVGIMDESKTERLGGLLLFALTLGRVVLVDLSGLDIIFKIITFIALGLLFLGISFVYNRMNLGQEKNKNEAKI